MSLLDNASLLLTPNAYKEGKLYSVIPSNGNGDFTATRATTATRVNADGLVDLVPYNLLQRSEEFNNGYWAKSNVTISSNSTTAPNGTLTADTIIEDTTNGQHVIFTTFGNFNSVPMTWSFYVKPNGRNRVLVREAASSGTWISFDLSTQSVLTSAAAGNCSFTGSVSAVDEYGFYRVTCFFTNNRTIASNLAISIFTLNSTGSTLTDTVYTGDGTSGIFIWGAQVVEGTSARDYLRTETRLNIPRVDYSLGGCPNILLEPQRTNLALQSSSFDSASWGKTASSVTANTTTSPSGVVDADTFIADGTSGNHQIGQIIGVTNAVTYSFSAYAKKGTNNFFQLLGSTGAFGSNVWANFNLDAGVVGSVGTATTASIQSVGNGWYRCTITGASIATTSAFMVLNLITSATSARNETNTLTTSVFLWGAQLEAGAYATSYIPTTTASVTRNADSITRNNIFTNGLITAAGGTWFMEFRNNRSLVRDGFSDGLWLRTAVGQDAFKIRNTYSAAFFLVVEKLVAGVSTILYTIPTSTAKVAIKWNGSTADIFVNGVKVVSATAFTATNMEILNGNGADVPRYINEMALFPTALTDTQLAQLTTL